MFKLRTMVRGAHAMLPDLRRYSEVDGPVFKMRDDPRLHRLGALLRRSSIDELPNFVNVLLGDMSIVGPRPPLPEEVAHYDAYAMRRLVGQARRDLPVADLGPLAHLVRRVDGARQRLHRRLVALVRPGDRRADDPGRHAGSGRALSPACAVVAERRTPRRLARSTMLVMAATLASTMLGFVREVVYAKFYGTSWELDAFLAAAVVPTILFGVFNGALVTALVPLFSDYVSHRPRGRGLVAGFDRDRGDRGRAGRRRRGRRLAGAVVRAADRPLSAPSTR